MRGNLRLSTLILLIGLSLILVTAIRTNSVPHTMSFDNEAAATTGWVMYPDFLLFSRDFSVDIRTNNSVDVYILNESAAKQWSNSGVLEAAWAFENIEQGVFSERSTNRGAYAILVHLPEDNATVVKVTLTFSGFEQDLLAVSVFVIIAGVETLAASLFLNRNGTKKAPSNGKVE